MTVTVNQPAKVVQRNIVVNADGTQTPQAFADMKASGTSDVPLIKVRVVRETDSTELLPWTIVAAADGLWSTTLVNVALDGKNEAKIEVENLDNAGDSDSKEDFFLGIVEVRSGQSNSAYWRSSTTSPDTSIATVFFSDYAESENEAIQPIPGTTPDGDGARREAGEPVESMPAASRPDLAGNEVVECIDGSWP